MVHMGVFGTIFLAFLLTISGGAEAKQPRDKKVLREFQREVPCPSTGKRRGKCPGYEADHIVPLCAGGKDEWSNLQWLTVREHREKTAIDKKHCASHRKDKNAQTGSSTSK